MTGLSEAELDMLATSFATATRSPHHLAFLAQPAVETIVAQREAAAVKAALLSAADDLTERGFDDGMPLGEQMQMSPLDRTVHWLRDRANRSEGGRA